MLRAYALVGVATFALGCQGPLESPAAVTGVRVLAVQATPASGSADAQIHLRMLVADGSVPVDVSPDLEIAWMGGCHNPPGRQFFACYPLLRAIAERLQPHVVETPSQSNYFAATTFTGSKGDPTFDFHLPSDILSAAPKLSTDAQHFGVSYTFFAACAGQLVPRPDLTDRVPLGCVDAQTGTDVAARQFVTGFSTLFTYEESTNFDPIVQTVHFGAVDTSMPCQEDSDCAASSACGPSNTCVPQIKPCRGGSCEKIRVDPIIDPASVEPTPAGREILWASYYATAGALDPPVHLVDDRSIGWIADHAGLYTPPVETPPGPVEVWVTVSDERGGVAWKTFQVLVVE